MRFTQLQMRVQIANWLNELCIVNIINSVKFDNCAYLYLPDFSSLFFRELFQSVFNFCSLSNTKCLSVKRAQIN